MRRRPGKSDKVLMNESLIQNEILSVMKDAGKYLAGIPNDANISFPGQFSISKKKGESSSSSSYDEWLKNLDQEEIRVAAMRMSSILWGNVVALPQVCPNLQKCVHKHICPFESNPPEGKACPMEQAYIMDKMSKLKKQFDIDGLAETDFLLLNKLVELDLYDLRINSMMAHGETQRPLYPRVALVSQDGVPIYQDEVNPLFEIKEKIGREKMKLMGILVGTPQERYKKQAALKEASTDRLSALSEKLNSLIEKAERELLASPSPEKGGEAEDNFVSSEEVPEDFPDEFVFSPEEDFLE